MQDCFNYFQFRYFKCCRTSVY